MQQIRTPNIFALRALALLDQHDRETGHAMVRHHEQAPQYFPQFAAPQPFMGNDLMGIDYLGQEGGVMLGEEAVRALESMLGAEGLEALLGRDPRRNRMHRAQASSVPVQAVPRHGYLPIPTTLIPTANPTAVINIFPQAQGGIQLTRLVVPSNQGTRFLINDVVVATRSQFLAPGAISAVMCSEVQTMHLRGDVAYPGTIVSITVTNVSGVDQTLTGAAFLAEARESRAV